MFSHEVCLILSLLNNSAGGKQKRMLTIATSTCILQSKQTKLDLPMKFNVYYICPGSVGLKTSRTSLRVCIKKKKFLPEKCGVRVCVCLCRRVRE